MYYQECDLLARDRPDLKDLIEKIDDKFYSVKKTGVLLPKDIASNLNVEIDKVNGIFLALAQLKLLIEENCFMCPYCETLIDDMASYQKAHDDRDPYDCSLCQRDISKTKLQEGKIFKIVKSPFPSNTIPIKQTTEINLVFENVSQTEVTHVRVGLVQIDFDLKKPLDDIGYIIDSNQKKLVERKMSKALEIAEKENINIVCFPELCFSSDWVESICAQHVNLIIIGGSYYEDGFNICPIIIEGENYFIQKINASPTLEAEIQMGRGMKAGHEIKIFQTKFGKFVVLVCMDFRQEIDKIQNQPDLNFVISPCYNRDVLNFQEQANQNCQRGNFPYVLLINVGKVKGETWGSTCIIGMDNNLAITTYRDQGICKINDPIQYKLAEADNEMIIIADLDIIRKGVPVPSIGGPKMLRFSKYIIKDNDWQRI
jgi:predicted amidohydrolase